MLNPDFISQKVDHCLFLQVTHFSLAPFLSLSDFTFLAAFKFQNAVCFSMSFTLYPWLWFTQVLLNKRLWKKVGLLCLLKLEHRKRLLTIFYIILLPTWIYLHVCKSFLLRNNTIVVLWLCPFMAAAINEVTIRYRVQEYFGDDYWVH